MPDRLINGPPPGSRARAPTPALAAAARSGRPRTLLADAADVFEEALAGLEACADVAALAGSRRAATYAAGAAGSLRHAMAGLAASASLPVGDGATFDVRRIGLSELVGTRGVVDTVRRCGLPGGGEATVKALLAGTDPHGGVWLRRDHSVPGLHFRGRLVGAEAGLDFHDDEDAEGEGGTSPVAPVPDLGRDLVKRNCSASLAPAAAAALQLTLASGSWVHLPTGRRWSIDPAGARAVVRMLGGRSGLSAAASRRIGPCVDAAWLRRIELLDWRHWPTPSLQC